MPSSNATSEADTPRQVVFRKQMRRWAGGVLDLVFPPQCLNCGCAVVEAGSVCADCWGAMIFLRGTQCETCGLPFELPAPAGTRCGACLRRPPVFERARAAIVYDDASRSLILGLKHADRSDVVPLLAQWMRQAAPHLLAEAELLAPVPLHWSRFFKRRFNQSAMLARALSGHGDSSAHFMPDLLIRPKRTPPQGGLNANARRKNVAGAFRVSPRRRSVIAGKRVLLIDDVYTTGATVASASQTLLRAGAGAVDVLTIARVVRPAA